MRRLRSPVIIGLSIPFWRIEADLMRPMRSASIRLSAPPPQQRTMDSVRESLLFRQKACIHLSRTPHIRADLFLYPPSRRFANFDGGNGRAARPHFHNFRDRVAPPCAVRVSRISENGRPWWRVSGRPKSRFSRRNSSHIRFGVRKGFPRRAEIYYFRPNRGRGAVRCLGRAPIARRCQGCSGLIADAALFAARWSVAGGPHSMFYTKFC